MPQTSDKHHKHHTCHEYHKMFITGIAPNMDSHQLSFIIYGRGFTNAKKINVNDKWHITDFTIVNDNIITFNILEIDTELNISISNNVCKGNVVTYNFNDAYPIITNISPSSGPSDSLINVTLFGNNLTTLKLISVGDQTLHTSSSLVSIISNNMISFMMPNVDNTTNIPIYLTTFNGISNTVYYHKIAPPMI